MSKFHLASDGPKECRARERTCPLGGAHFSTLDAAEKAFAANLGAMKPHRKSSVGDALLVVQSSVKPLAGGRYFGCEVPKDSLKPSLEAWRREIGEAKAKAMEELKAQRDRGYIYHMTAIGPPEMKALKKGLVTPPEDVAIEYLGVGTAEDKGHEAWYMVCRSDDVQSWRSDNGLTEKDLHITLGFMPKDVHSKPKGASTIIAL